MKCVIELNQNEMEAAVAKGTLLALSESIKGQEQAVSCATPPLPVTPAPQFNQQPPQQQPPQQQFTPQQPPQQFNQQPPQQFNQQQPPQQQQQQQQQQGYGQQPPQQQFNQQPPQQQQQFAPGGVPTTNPTYTFEQLAVAATQLNDAGRRTELVVLLNSFNIPSLTSLPKEQYGAFATQLRAMGAKI